MCMVHILDHQSQRLDSSVYSCASDQDQMIAKVWRTDPEVLLAHSTHCSQTLVLVSQVGGTQEAAPRSGNAMSQESPAQD